MTTDTGFELITLTPTKKMPLQVLKRLLPDIQTALFFAKVYKLEAENLTTLIARLFRMDLIEAFTSEGHLHSNELQEYLIDTVPEVIHQAKATFGKVEKVPDTVLLGELWEAAEVEVAKSIQDVATKLEGVLHAMPGTQGETIFKHLRELNVQRNQLGASFKMGFKHKTSASNLVILDVSGSMTAETIRKIASEVVGLAIKADAELAIVSNTTFHWKAGEATVDSVLNAAEFGGTRYETLAPLFDRNYGTVVTIADYDSAVDARACIASQPGRIGKLLDISLVNRPTYLGECVGQLAAEVKPLMIGSSRHVLGGRAGW
jgi:hypothetical protein